jgi:integrase
MVMGKVVSMRKTPATTAPSTENRTVVTRLGKTNAAMRPREHLTPAEVDRLLKAAGSVGRYGHRDATLLLVAYRHGLRVSELVALEWHQVDFKAGVLQVVRRKSGTPSTHPLRGPEIRALRRLHREQQDGHGGTYVFTTERGGPMTADNVRRLMRRAGELAGLPWPVHPHVLRHSCGYKLANDGHDTRALAHWLGHRNIQNTMRYTELAPGRFKDFWRD